MAHDAHEVRRLPHDVYIKSSAAVPHARHALGVSQTSEATSVADFGEGVRAGDDFMYTS